MTHLSMHAHRPGVRHSVHIVSLGCARNDVDSEELAARLEADGFDLVAEPAQAETVVVNTCGFVEQAKKDSVDTLLAAADLKGEGSTRSVVAVGCLAERYGVELAEALPEADAVLGFDDYPEIAQRLQSLLAGEPHRSHTPRDRRRLLPVAPVARKVVPLLLDPVWPGGPTGGPAAGPRIMRRRLDDSPVAPLRLASGCDRRCSFCAIPSFRGSFLSRPPAEVLAEAGWLAAQGVREVVLVSENSTSYGKDLGDLRLLEDLLPEIAAVEGIERVRVSYLQPAEVRPSLLAVMAQTTGVADYFDLSFQHASPRVLRRMRRFGSTDRFLELLGRVRSLAPSAGARSNVIVGFPGETDDDLAELERFLGSARLDAVGVFGYSDEDGTEAATLSGKIPPEEVAHRVEHITVLAEALMLQRADERIGTCVDVLVERVADGVAVGRAAHQGPEIDGEVTVLDGAAVVVGGLVRARVVAAPFLADLHARLET